jgi:hypothetical protein
MSTIFTAGTDIQEPVHNTWYVTTLAKSIALRHENLLALIRSFLCLKLVGRHALCLFVSDAPHILVSQVLRGCFRELILSDSRSDVGM